MRFLLEAFALVMEPSAQTVNAPLEPAHRRQQFGDRMQASQRRRDAIASAIRGGVDRAREGRQTP